jgi:NADPH:quinone reductase-like Zn-dependent oxidoreductase
VRAAVLYEYGSPEPGEFVEPTLAAECSLVDVEAAAVNPFDVLVSSGKFYVRPSQLPCVVGLDGAGRLADGRRVYFESTVAPFGSVAERTLVQNHAVIDLPDELDYATAAALGNSGLAAWLSLSWRAKLQAGETLLILGATGAVGSIAVQVAKLLGAGKVVAAGRDEGRLDRLRELGADACVSLASAESPSLLQEALGDGADVVLDLVWGAPIALVPRVCAQGARIIQVGNVAGSEATLEAGSIRSKALSIMGYANYNVPPAERKAAYQSVAAHAAAGRITVDIERVPLDAVGEAWELQRVGAHVKQIVIPAQVLPGAENPANTKPLPGAQGGTQ